MGSCLGEIDNEIENIIRTRKLVGDINIHLLTK